MNKDVPHLLLINPWIHDFAAFDFWAKPLGLLMLGGILRKQGYRITYIDCLDRFHPGVENRPRQSAFGKGHYLKTPIQKPDALRDVPRNFSRYGLPESLVRKAIDDCHHPDAILVTGLMTYWYPGVFAIIDLVRELKPDVPILLGGIYACLCQDHAVGNAGADQVLPIQDEALVVDSVDRLTGFSGTSDIDFDNLDCHPHACFDLQHVIAYVPVLTGRGCPYQCHYCASSFLNRQYRRRSPGHVVEEIAYWYNAFGVIDYAFYDDALLIDPENHIMPILEGIIELEMPLRFHTPNALHIRALSRDVAKLLFRAGFKTIRLGLETTSFKRRESLDSKVGPEEFEQAVSNLKEAGFAKGALGAYLLFGLPDQDITELEASVQTVKDLGVQPVLAQYSPIPHTRLWEDAVASSRYDLASEPLFHNCSIFPCQKAPFSWKKVSRLKRLTRDAGNRILSL